MKSKSLPERIALIEFDSSHDECLLTQINALKKRGCWVLLVTNELIRKRNLHLKALVDEWIDIDSRPENQRKGLTGAAIGDALIIRRLMRKLKTMKIDRAVFNTAQGGHVRNACLFSLFRKIEFVGIIHTIRKFQGSFTQKVISLKIKKHFVLAEFLVSSPLISNPLNPRIETSTERSRRQVFYPVDFPNLPINHEPMEQLHISLVGTVEKRRKDLDGFISLIQQCDPSVRFSFLGKADSTHPEVIEFKEKLDQVNCLERVEFFDNYINSESINEILQKTNALLPLIHPNTPCAKEYFRNQIPGAMNIALGYKIPLLMHESFRRIDELNTASVYYETHAFSVALDELKMCEKTIRETMHLTEKYSLEHQYKVFLKFLFDH